MCSDINNWVSLICIWFCTQVIHTDICTLLQKRRTRMSQRPKHLPESLYLAGKGFVMSVATGLSGVLVHPIRGTKQEMCINRSHQTNSQYREMEINLISTSIARCSRMEYHCKCTICCRDIWRGCWRILQGTREGSVRSDYQTDRRCRGHAEYCIWWNKKVFLAHVLLL